ncbi:MAG TPA: hypothetical protein VM691_06570 [Myxococcales bacterium]|nr:hypothetical protein [Myxococcales bacterium]
MDPSTDTDARTKKTRVQASAAMLAWMTFLLLFALTGGGRGRFTERQPAPSAAVRAAR